MYQTKIEEDPREVQASLACIRALDSARVIDGKLDEFKDPADGSSFEEDERRNPHYSNFNYARAQLATALGSLETLRQLLVRDEHDGHVEVAASPFGTYSLIRNSLDCAAMALWVLEPKTATGRIKRRIQTEMDEIKNVGYFATELGARGIPAHSKTRRDRLQAVASGADIHDWNVRADQNELPSTTKILKAIERYAPKDRIEWAGQPREVNRNLTWLATWQLCSGHAHGKQWSVLQSNDMDEIEGTRTDVGAVFMMSIRYESLAPCAHRAMELSAVAARRFMDLCGE